jgi:hypothetical protein
MHLQILYERQAYLQFLYEIFFYVLTNVVIVQNVEGLLKN